MGVLRLEKNGVMIRLKVGKGSAKVLVQEYMILSSLALDITDLPADLLNIQEEFIRILFGLGSGIIHREVYVGLFFEEVFLGMRGIHGKFGQVFRLGEVFKSGNLFPDVLGRSLVRNVCREVCFWEVYGAYSGNKGLWESFGILRCVTAESLLGLVVIYVEGKRRKCITREFNWLLLPICWVVALCGLTLGMSCWECREWSFSGNWEFFPKCGISEGKCLGGKDIRDPLALSFHSGDGSLRDGRGCLGIFTSGKDPYAGWDIGGVNDGKQCWSDAIGSFQCLYDREVVTLGNGEGTGGYGQFWGFKGCADYGGKQSVVLGCGLPGIFSGNLIVGTRGDNMGSFIVLDVRLPLVSEGIDVLSGTREIGILVSYGSGKFRDVVLCYGEEIGYLRSFGNGEDWLVWVSGEIGGKDMAVGVLGYGRGMFRGVWGGKVGSVKLVIVRDVDVFHEDLLDILRNSDVALCYGESGLTVKGYVDSDYAGDLDRSKSTIGYVFTLSGGIGLVSLNRGIITLFYDNQSALYLARNSAFHSKTKHIRVQYHFIREKVEEGTVDMQKIHTDPQERAEILLQSLPDSYDQVIINLTSNVLTDCLVFDDVAASTLKEENRRNNREGLTKTSSRRGGSFGGVMRGEVNGTWLLGGVTIMVKSKTGKSHVQVGKQLCLWNCTTFAILSSYRGGRAVNSSRTHDIQMRSFWIRKARQEEIEAYP
ncbi:hypothetical protein Tco_0318362 [Tanacetum coccineum]